MENVKDRAAIIELSAMEVEEIGGGLIPLVIYFVAGTALGAATYLASEYLN